MNMKTHKLAQKLYNKNCSQNADKSVNTIIKLVGLFSAFTGVFAALIYIAGRYYSFGYFQAMNIPEYLLTFSINEYGAVAWRPIFIYPTLVLLFGSAGLYILVKILKFISNTKFISSIIDWIRTNIRTHNNHKDNTFFEQFSKKVFLISILFLTLIIESDYIFSMIKDEGEKNGKTALLENSRRIHISPVTSSNTNTNINNKNFEEFYLITNNNGNYYLFKTLDPETCSPEQIYIINESSIAQVILSPAEDLSDQCKEE